MEEAEVVRMELKYCECCGALLMRPAGNGAVYCPDCAPRMNRVVNGRGRVETRGRKRKSAAEAAAIETQATEAPTVEASMIEINAVAEFELPPPRPMAGVGEFSAEQRRWA